jgi:hypothetical protein
MKTALARRLLGLGVASVAGLGLWAPGQADAASARAVTTCQAFSFGGPADYDHDGHQDLVARRNSTGDLWLFPGESKRAYSQQQPAQIGNGWTGYYLEQPADWDHDGHQDLIAKDWNGDLWLYPGESKRGYSSQQRIKIGNGWTGFDIVGAADWDHDGHQDLIAKDGTNGNLWLYPGESRRGYSQQPRALIGNGWQGYKASLSDWDHDGKMDLVAIQVATGDLWLYPGENKRAYSSQQRVLIGNGWGDYTIAGEADWDHDGHQDIIAAANTTGDLWLYPGESKRAYSGQQRVKIGNGWC